MKLVSLDSIQLAVYIQNYIKVSHVGHFWRWPFFKFAAKLCILRMHWRIDTKLGMRLRLPVDFFRLLHNLQECL